MEGVAELVEEGDDVVEGEEGGFAGGGRGEVGDVVDDGEGAEELGLADEGAHPGAAALVVAFVEVDVDEGDGGGVGVVDLEDAHAGGVGGEVMALVEGEAEEEGGGVKDAALEDGGELEEGLEGLLVEVEACAAELLGEELPVPGLEGEAGVGVVVDLGLEVSGLLGGVGAGLGGESGEEVADGRGVVGHLVVELPGGVGGEAEELRLFGAELSEPGDEIAGVVFVGLFGAGEGVLKEKATGFAVGEGGEDGLLGGVVEGEEEAGEVAGMGAGLRGGELGGGEAGEGLGIGEVEGGGFVCGEEAGAEGGGEGGLFLVELAEAGLAGGVEEGAGVDELPVGDFEEAELFGGEGEGGAELVKAMDAGEECGVEGDGVGVGGEAGCHGLLDGLEGWVGVGGGEGAEDAEGAVEEGAGALEGFEGVAEGRWGGVLGYRADFAELDGHAGLDGGLEVGVADAVEGRGVKGEGAGRGEGV